LFGSKRASADHVIERAAYKASQRGEGADVVVATDDRLERDVVGAMGVATMGARALEAEVARIAGTVDTETRRMRDDSRRSSRLEDGLDPEIRRRLERIRRGEDR
jgi:predicted RNA-binding protein with PIN domain